ncbi:MAG: twin-arginine translocation signal domain-containing protein, partial [Rhizobiales bacterium]|nr:twin-arginine translocation signal domain-containing protein [Hyphomicrobiales bacterium]
MTDDIRSGVNRRNLLKLTAVAGVVAGTGLLSARTAAAEELSLKGKRIGISTAGTDH